MRDERGQTSIEYGLALLMAVGMCLIVAAALGALPAFIAEAVESVF